ncbi:MAG: TetR/AcrR family transcriptional regulator [Cyanobium sp.]
MPTAERRARAIQALLELACSCAPEQITTAAIAERMGISHAALFRHFPSREALWAECVGWATSLMLAQLLPIAADQNRSSLERIEAMLLANGDFVCRHPGLLRMLLSELPRPVSSPASQEAKAFGARLRSLLIPLLEQAQGEGLLREDLAPPALAALLLAASEGMMLQGLIHDSLEELPDRIRAALPLLLPRPGPNAPSGSPQPQRDAASTGRDG